MVNHDDDDDDVKQRLRIEVLHFHDEYNSLCWYLLLCHRTNPLLIEVILKKNKIGQTSRPGHYPCLP